MSTPRTGRASTAQRAWQSTKVRYSCLLILVLLLLTLGAGLLSPYPYDEIDAAATFGAPGQRYLIGADALGRDVLSRTLHGGRMSLVVGLLATLVAVLVGVPLGALAGYVGGRIDWLISRVVGHHHQDAVGRWPRQRRGRAESGPHTIFCAHGARKVLERGPTAIH